MTGAEMRGHAARRAVGEDNWTRFYRGGIFVGLLFLALLGFRKTLLRSVSDAAARLAGALGLTSQVGEEPLAAPAEPDRTGVAQP